MSYIYKSITGRTVNIKDYTISDNGLEFDSPVQALDDYLGILLSRLDNGVEKLVDPENVISYIGQFANLSALQAAHPAAPQLSVAILNTDPITIYEYISGTWTQRSSGLATPEGPLTKSSVGLGQVDNTADVDKPVSTLQAAAIAAKYTKPVGGIPETDLDMEVQVALSLASGIKYTIGDTPTTFRLSSLGLAGLPFTFEVSPDVVTDPSVSIRVDVSFDDGSTYALVDTFTSYSTRRWVRSPEEAAPTHLMIYRVTGTSVASEFIIGA